MIPAEVDPLKQAFNSRSRAGLNTCADDESTPPHPERDISRLAGLEGEEACVIWR